MKTVYTCGGTIVPVYLTEEQYEIVGNLKIYQATKGNLVCTYKGKTISFTSLLYPDRRRVTRIDTTVHDYRPSNISDAIKLAGVYKTKIRGITYFIGRVSRDGKQVSIPGYYKTQEEALLTREAYIITNELDKAERNDIGLSDSEILQNYELLVKQREQQMKETLKERGKKKHKYALVHRDTYGIYCGRKLGRIFYQVIVEGKPVGASQDMTVSKCIRNLYILDNNIQDDKIYDVGMTVEEQREFVEAYKSKARLPIINGKKFRGVYAKTSQKGYAVQVYTKDKLVFVGSSQDQRLAAMMYNIYKVNTSNITESINDVGLTLDEQLKVLLDAGYYITENFRFKNTRRKNSK